MMELRKGSTVTVSMGPFVSQSDGFTPKTALTPTVKLAKNGGTLAARSSATAITHDADGLYKVELNATDTGTEGRLRALVTDIANHLPVWEDFMVVSAAWYDEKYAVPLLLQAAAAGSATLDAGASAVDDYYKDSLIVITSGTGAGQTRRITASVGATKVVTIDRNWGTNPTSSSAYRIISSATIAIAAAEKDAIAVSHLDLVNGVETGLTVRNAHRIEAAAAGGKLSGATGAPGTITIRNAVADSKNRVVAAVDAFGNRSSVTTDFT